MVWEGTGEPVVGRISVWGRLDQGAEAKESRIALGKRVF